MSTINYTYNVIVDRFRQFAAGHFQLRRFTHGEISQADLEKEAEWPWLHVKPRAINYSPGTRSFSFEIFISDLPRDKEDKTGYQAESITDCSLIFQDLINEIYLGNMFGSDVVLTRPVNSEPFVEQYTHTLTGVTGTIELNLDYDWSACSIPASWNYNTPTDSGTDGWGALQFIESLEQNGVYVSLLNDEEAPGNSYYYGTNASGVKGWHAIVDNVGLTCETLPDCATIISILEDIEALESAVALKANSADLGATAFSNDYADLDNLPTIPSIAGLVPETRTLTINGTSQDLSADRSYSIDKASVGLGNVDNTSDLNKPVSTATQTALNLKQNTLVSGTNIKTINGASVLGSGDLVVGGSTSLAVGTTPITSGTIGRVLFEGTGNVLQQSANFFWDATNNRLGIGTASPATPLEVIGRITLGRDAAVTTQIVSIIQAKDTNGSIVLQPNGTGSILANIPDGTATGGNARGANSVDLQMSRTTAGQVALSPFSVIGGGKGNSILQGHEGQVVAGGDRNAISFGSYNTISGGQLNTAGNAAGRLYATVVGGRSNLASGTGTTVGGEQNNVGNNATDSTAFGRLITITGQFSAGFGYNFSMSGEASFGMTLGARSTAPATTLLGVNGNAYLPSQLVHGTSYAAPVYEGSHQSSEILPMSIATLTTGQTSAITCGGTLIIPTGTNRIWNVEINTTAVVTAITGTATGVAVGNVYFETKKLCFKKVGGVSSVVGSVDTVYVKSDGGMTTASVTAAAGASQSLALTFTAPTFAGGGSVSVRVLSKVDLVEVAY